MALQQLIEQLEQLNQSHQIMLELGQMKKEVIIKNDVEQLIQIMNRESRVMKQIEQQENERIQASYAFLHERGIKSLLNLTITELSRLVFDPAEKQRLLHIQSELSGTMKQLKEINQLNQQLIEQSLAFIDYSLDVLVGPPEEEVIYQHPGEKSAAMNRPGLFDTRA